MGHAHRSFAHLPNAALRAASLAALLLFAALPGASSAPLEDDAGSGRDAPGAPLDLVRVAPGVVYEAAHGPSDADDHYSFVAQAGDALHAYATGEYACLWLVDAAGAGSDRTCPIPHGYPAQLRATIPADGVWFLRHSSYLPPIVEDAGAGVPRDVKPGLYRFSFALGADAPYPLPADPNGLVPGAPSQDDAGSGTDAPGTLVDLVRIDSGRLHQANLTGPGTDDRDVYAFEAQAGDRIQYRVWGGTSCNSLFRPDGSLAASGCGVGEVGTQQLSLVADATGVWFADFYYFTPETYFFSVGVEEPAADPAPLGLSVLGQGGFVPRVAPATQSGEHVVVAVVDTGINPYHDFFRAPGLADHPSTWLAGFPAGATSVPLSLGASNFTNAMAADAALWASLQRASYDVGTDSFDAPLYTFPGTRVVGAVSFGEYGDVLAAAGTVPVYDEHGHGTHSAGLAAGANLPQADGNVLVVMVEVSGGTWEEGVRWAARQPWIDAISVSAGVRANAPVTESPLGDRQGMEWASLEAATAGKPVFMASGNGFTNTGVAPDHCATHTSPFTGPAWITRIGAADPNNGNPTVWHCLPVEAVARTNVLSPDTGTFTSAGSASGTSAATPNAAGHWALLHLDGLRAGVGASRTESLQHLLNASQPAPAATGLNSEPSLAATAPLDQGYGLVDAGALARARATLLAGGDPTPRPDMDAWVAADRAVRTALWGPGGLTATETVREDDAGSGRDAGEGPDAVPVQPGVAYEGLLNVLDRDEYSFEASAGQTLRLGDLNTGVNCWSLIAPSGSSVAIDCFSLGATQPIVETGTHRLRVIGLTPAAYWFGFTLDGSPPPRLGM